MAEFLILKKPHWATVADVGEVFNPMFGEVTKISLTKYNARQQPGDIVAVREDGYFRVEALHEGQRGWHRGELNLVRMKGLDLKEVKRYALSISGIDAITGNTICKRKFGFYVPTWDKLPWKKNIVKVNGTDWEECYLDLKSLAEFPVLEKVVL